MTEAAKPRRPGRPVKEDAVRRRPSFTFRASEQTRKLLEQAAVASGRSVSEEIEHRLEKSLGHEEVLTYWFGSKNNVNLARIVAFAINSVEQETGKKWNEDSYTCRVVQDAVGAALNNVIVRQLERLPALSNEQEAAQHGRYTGHHSTVSHPLLEPAIAQPAPEVAAASVVAASADAVLAVLHDIEDQGDDLVHHKGPIPPS